MNALTWLDRNKWFVLAAAFLGINVWGIFRLSAPWQDVHQYVYASFEPGDNALVVSNSVLGWEFSEAMVSPERVGKPEEAGPVSFAPLVKGRYLWIRPNRLEFHPAGDWTGCTFFTAGLDHELKSLAGKPVAPPRSFAFQSAPLEWVSIGQVDFTSDRRVTLKLVFTAPVSAAALAKALELESPKGAPLKWSALGQADSLAPLIQTEPVGADQVLVRIRKELQSVSGPRPLGADIERQAKCYDTMIIHSIKPASESFEQGVVRFETSKPLDLNTASAFIEIKPKLDFAVEASPYSWNNSEYRILGNFQPARTYSVVFREGLRSTDDSILTKDAPFTAYFPDRPSAISLRTAGHYLSSRGNMLAPVSSVNVPKFKATARRIFPNNLVQFAMRKNENYSGYYWDLVSGLGRVEGEKEYAVNPAANQVTETAVDLRDLLGGQVSGAYWLTFEGSVGGSVEHLAIVSDTGLSVKRSRQDLLVWANSLFTLAPVTGAEVRVFSRDNQPLDSGTTDDQGLAHFAGDFTGDREPFLVTVQNGADLTYLDLQETKVNLPAEGDSGRPYSSAPYDAYLYTDRGVYRPGETTHLRAVVRETGFGGQATNLACPSPFPIELHVLKPDGKTRQVIGAMLGAMGAADFEIAWEDFDATGAYALEVRTPGGDTVLGSVSVALEEFVPPQIAVDVSADPARGRTGEDLEFRVRARHLFGAKAAGNSVRAAVRYLPEDFKHKDWPDYVFGDPEKDFKPVLAQLGSTRLDQEGAAVFIGSVPEAWRPPSSLKALFEATVVESGGRAVTAYASRPVDVYPWYLGIKPGQDSGAYKAGVEMFADVAAVNPDGTIYAGIHELKLELCTVSWSTVFKQDGEGRYISQSERRVTPVQSLPVALTNGQGRVRFTPSVSGLCLARVSDPSSDVSASFSFYVGSPDQEWMAWSMETPDRVSLQLDKPSYTAGDKAVLVIKAPFTGKALLTIESDRVLNSQVVILEKNTAEIEIPVRADYKPNVYCTVSLLRGIKPGEVWSAHRAAGSISLVVEMPEVRLDVLLKSPDRIRPREKLQVEIQVRDESKNGVESEVTLAAVDEGICMLTGFASPDPLGYFCGPYGAVMELFDLYSLLMPEIEKRVMDSPSAPGGGAGDALRRRLNPVKARRFKPVALWSTTRTGADGQAKVTFDIPEFTGELRLMAVAVSKNALGATNRGVLVKRPLIVRHSLPRFLAPSDSCAVPVEVFNETGAHGTVLLTVTCQGPLSTDAREIRLDLAPGASRSAVFHLTAAPKAGKAVVTLRARLGGETFAEDIELAVRPAATLTVASGSVAIPAGEQRKISIPGGWLDGTPRITVAGSGLPELELGGGLEYLLSYPYGCIEQTASASFPLLYLADLAGRLRPGSMNREQVTAYAQAGVFRVLSMQLANGGFGYWPNTTALYEWGSIYAAHFLVEASNAGLDVPKDRLSAACEYLEKFLSKPVQQPQELNLRSYACLVLALAGRVDGGWLARLREQEQDLDFNGRLCLVAALAASGQRREASRLLPALNMSDAEVPSEVGGRLNSTVRNLALLLSVWIDLDPESPAVPALVERLAGLQKGGAWNTTQDNAMALMALGKYYRRVLSGAKAFDAELTWMGGHESQRYNQKEDAIFKLADEGLGDYGFTNSGPGMAYGFWRVEGVPLAAQTNECDTLLRARRRILDLQGNEVPEFSFLQGDLVVVEWTVDAGEGMDNLVIEDLLPAGFEVENAQLKTSQLVPWVREKSTLPLRNVDLRDDRVIGFTEGFSGERRFYYAVRAVTEGRFDYPALSASCMYDGEIRSVSGRTNMSVKAQP